MLNRTWLLSLVSSVSSCMWESNSSSLLQLLAPKALRILVAFRNINRPLRTGTRSRDWETVACVCVCTCMCTRCTKCVIVKWGFLQRVNAWNGLFVCVSHILVVLLQFSLGVSIPASCICWHTSTPRTTLLINCSLFRSHTFVDRLTLVCMHVFPACGVCCHPVRSCSIDGYPWACPHRPAVFCCLPASTKRVGKPVWMLARTHW